MKQLLEPRQNVKLWKTAKVAINGVVTAVQPFGEIRKNLISSSLSSESVGDAVEVSDVYVNDGMFAQVYVQPLDDIGIQIAPLGKENKLGRLKNTSPYITRYDIERYGRNYYFIQLEDEPLYMYPYNPTQDTISLGRVLMFGWLYTFEKVSDEEADEWAIWNDEFLYTLR